MPTPSFTDLFSNFHFTDLFRDKVDDMAVNPKNPADYIQVAKNGKMNTIEKPNHKMLKHSSPLAQDEQGLYEHNLYSAIRHIGFGIKTYV